MDPYITFGCNIIIKEVTNVTEPQIFAVTIILFLYETDIVETAKTNVLE